MLKVRIFVYESQHNTKDWKHEKMSWVSTKFVRYLERGFKPQGTVNFELKVSNFGIALREKT